MWKYFWLNIVLASIISLSAQAQNLTVLTDEFPPFNYLENGKVMGISADVVQATLAKAGIQAEIKVYPWARLYRMVTEDPNVLAFSMARMPDREKLFKWVGPIAPPICAALFKMKTRSDITLKALTDAQKYKVGVVRDDGGHQLLKAQGFTEDQNMFPVTSGDQNLQKLFAGRIDLMFSDNMFMLLKTKTLGLDYAQIAEALVFMEIENYMVFSLQTPDAVVARVQAAFEQLQADSTVKALADKYLQALQ